MLARMYESKYEYKNVFRVCAQTVCARARVCVSDDIYIYILRRDTHPQDYTYISSYIMYCDIISYKRRAEARVRPRASSIGPKAVKSFGQRTDSKCIFYYYLWYPLSYYDVLYCIHSGVGVSASRFRGIFFLFFLLIFSRFG